MRRILCAVGVTTGGLAAFYLAGRHAIAQLETIDSEDLAPAPGAGFVQTRSGQVHYRDTGKGPPVLLFHGSGRSIDDWQEGVAQRLSQRRQVIALDFYGFGRSERNSRFTYGYDLWVRQAIDLLDALAVDRVTIIGHSVGGALACMVAASHPDRVDRVVTIGTGLAIEPAQFLPAIPGVGELIMARQTMFGPSSSEPNREALELAYKVRGTRAALLTYIRRQMTVDGVRLLRGVFEDVKVPVLHVSGAQDRNISPDAARRLSQRTGGRFVIMPGVGHSVHTDRPGELVQEIEHFLEGRR